VISMRYLSVCSGIEAASVAWEPLGWEAAAFSEIDPFARAVLTHHFPSVPLHGDFTTIGADDYGAIDLLVGGTPCQDFSIAGLRAGMAGVRGNLTLEFLRTVGVTPDGPRYRALGNSMAVPCMSWIGGRISAVEALCRDKEASAHDTDTNVTRFDGAA
jgi:site-specific DNA-cytosine methylase